MENDIAVLIPNYNGGSGLLKSINSISEKECVDVIVVDDGSIKNLIIENEINNVFKAKGKIIFIYFKKNVGIAKALNHGLEYIVDKKYNYIARLDSGDICLTDRFTIQKDFLVKNPLIKLIGSNVIVNDMEGNLLFKLYVPTKNEVIKKKIFINYSTVIHPTIMFKTEILPVIGYFPTKYGAGEDYSFYFNVLKKFQISNINLFLLQKEMDPESLSIKHRKHQMYAGIRIIMDNFYIGFYPLLGLFLAILKYVIPNNFIINTKKILKRGF